MRISVLGCLFLMFASMGAGATFGIAPPNADLGTVRPGETLRGQIFISTDQEEPIEISPSASPPRAGSIYGGGNDLIDPEAYSDEDISDWVVFTGPSRIDPSTYNPPEGAPDDVDGAIEYEIQLPQDADPGYHGTAIDINPAFDGGGGAGAVVRAVSQYEAYFRVEGTASRDVTVESARAFRTGEQEVRVDVLFRNTGTVTTEVIDGTMEVRDNSGNLIRTVDIGRFTFAPGEQYYAELGWSGESVEAGTYQLSISGDYRTDTAFGDAGISIPEAVEIVPSAEQDPNEGLNEDEDEGVPFWLVALALALTGILLYAFDIDPTWIVIVIGGLGITAFILMSGVPNMMIVVLALLGATAYYIA